MTDRAATVVDRVLGIAPQLVAIGVAYGLLAGRIDNAETRAAAAEVRSDITMKAQGEIRERLIRIETVLEERLPPKPH